MKALNAAIVRTLPLVPKSIVRRIASRYVAGETLEEALDRALRGLNRRGLHGHPRRPRRGRHAVATRPSRRSSTIGRRSPRSPRAAWTPTSPSSSRRSASSSIPRSAARSSRASSTPRRRQGNFVRIDMEDSSVTEETIRIFLEFRETLSRASASCSRPISSAVPATPAASPQIGGNVRVCKGIYVEPPEIAHQDRERDPPGLHGARRDPPRRALLRRASRPTTRSSSSARSRRSRKRRSSRARPTSSRCCSASPEPCAAGSSPTATGSASTCPYGEAWYAYSIRRLKENPSIAGHVLKGLFHREERPG